jgi:uncharacterized protein YjdB
MQMIKPLRALVVVSLVSLAACNTDGSQPSVSSVTINSNPGTVVVGNTLALSADVQVKNGASKVVSWSSDKPNIASVNINSGLVKGEAPGSATITVTSVADPSKSSSVTISVTANANITAVTISPRSASLPIGSEQQFSASVSGTGSFSQAVSWVSSDAGVAEVSTSGLVKAKAVGSVTISAASVADPSKKDSVNVSVSAASPLNFATYLNLVAEINKPIPNQNANISGGQPPYSFTALSALPAGLGLNPTTGAISGTPTVASAASNYSIQVKDSLNNTATAIINITVFVPTPTLSYTTPRELTVGRAIGSNNYTVSTSGLSGTLTFALSSGALPPGISLGPSDGGLSGTPSASGSYNAVVRVTDANAATVTGNLALKVNAAPSISSGYPALTATVGVTFTSSGPTVSGGTAPLTFSAPGLPAGLNIRSSDGAISGVAASATPTANYSVTVTDANGASVNTVASITVNSGISLSYTLKRALTEDIAISDANYGFSVSGGALPYTFSVDSGELPVGITLNPNTGALSGTSVNDTGTFEVSITVTDANQASAISTFNLIVNPPINVLTDYVNPPNLKVGVAFTSSTPALEANTGTAPFTYQALTPLPAGLSIAPSTGVISGTPQASAANKDYAIEVKDANGDTEPLEINLQVDP